MNLNLTAPRAKITRLTIFTIVLINLFLPVVLSSLFNRKNMVNEPRMFWILPVTTAAFSLLMMFVSLFAVVIIQKQRFESLIYLIGQLVVTAAIFTLMFIGLFSRPPAISKVNRETLTFRDEYDTFRLQSLQQLENTFSNKDELKVESWFVNPVGAEDSDSVCAVFLIYVTKKSPDQKLTSKHIFMDSSSKIIYSGRPYTQNEELINLRADLKKQAQEVIGAAARAMDSAKKHPDSFTITVEH